MSLLILLPTLHERENLTALIPEIFKHVPDAMILIADDHSQDGTSALARDRVVVLDRLTDHGYGKAVMDGFRWAIEHKIDRLVTMDADFSHDPSLLPALIEALNDSDVVVGSRYVAGGMIANWNWYRRLLSRFANWYVRFLLGVPISDITTGYTAYRIPVIKELVASRIHAEGYSFLVACKYLMHRAKFRIREIPITFYDRREGSSKMSWKIIWESIWLPWRLRFARLKE